MSSIIYDIINNSMYVLMAYLFSGVFLKKSLSNNMNRILLFLLWIVLDNILVNILAGYPGIKIAVTLVLNCLFAFILFESSIIRLITTQIAFMGLGAVSELVVLLSLEMTVGTNNLKTIQNTALYFIGGIFSQIIIFTVIIILSRVTKNDDFGFLRTGEWLQIMVLPLMTIGIVIGIFNAFNNDINELQINVLNLMVLGILLINVCQYYLVRDLARKESLLRDSQVISERARSTNQLYDQLAKDREIHKAKEHDTIKLLSTAASMAQDAGNDRLYQFLSENLDVTESSMDVFDCGNAVINALINTKYNEARRNDIPLNYALSDLSQINLPDVDVVSIIANILDNAIEASIKSDVHKRHIRFKASVNDGLFNVACENYYSGKILSDEKGIKSDKKSEGHGYGLLNIKAIAQKYNGDCSIDTDNNLFRISVIIPMAK